MSATVFCFKSEKFSRLSPNETRAILDFVPPEPRSAVPEDGEDLEIVAFQAYFERFGVPVHLNGSWRSLFEGWLFLHTRVSPLAKLWHSKPQDFLVWSNRWSSPQKAYIEAVARSDLLAARQLVGQTPYWAELRTAMTRGGASALNETAVHSLA